MKEILDNWKQFIGEEDDKKTDFSFHDIVRKKFKLESPSSDKVWQKIKNRVENYDLKKISDAMRSKIYYTFDSTVGGASFIRLVRDSKEIKNVDPKASDEKILQYYNDNYLPKIKKILDELPVVNLASKEAGDMWQSGVEYAAESWANNRNLGGFFAYDKRFGSLPPFIGINPYSAVVDPSGIPNIHMIKKVLLEEFAHAVDLMLEMPFSKILKSDLLNITKQQKDTDVEQEEYYGYLKKPMEIYAKLKVIKTELMGINKNFFFADDGRINLQRLRDYLEDPRNKDHEIIRRHR